MQPPKSAQKRLTALEKIQESLLGILLVIIILLACLQVILRGFFSTGVPWADPLLRYLVLWSGLLGAVMATSQGSHIAIDLATFIVPKSMHSWVNCATHLVSTIVAGFLTYASYLFIKNEMSYGGALLFTLPPWIWNLIFPLAFSLMTFHFFMATYKSTMELFSSRSPREQE